MEIVKTPIRAQADIHQASNHGCTPLWIAAFPNHINVVRVLVNGKAKLDKFAMNGTIPCECNCKCKSCNRKRKEKSSLIYVAAQNGHIKFVLFLGDVKANLDKAEDMDGTTPLYIAW